MAEPILDVRDIDTSFYAKDGAVHAVRGVSFQIEPGKVLAIVGESGSGKSTLALSLMRLVPFPGRINRGAILLGGRDLMAMSDDELRRVRGRQMSMIFQDPISGLNPVLPVGKQVEEILVSHLDIPKKERKRRAIDVLRAVGLADPERVAESYPFHLSGGMCQRVMIAMATALNPSVIVADEPTSSLDVTVQAQILQELNQLRRTRGTAIVLITHDFGVVAQMADDVAVMYGGSIIEQGPVQQVYREPRHPYTWALLSTLPRIDGSRGPLHAIPGSPPNLAEPATTCAFLPRCPKATNQCRTDAPPPLVAIGDGGRQRVACYNPVFHDWVAADDD